MDYTSKMSFEDVVFNLVKFDDKLQVYNHASDVIHIWPFILEEAIPIEAEDTKRERKSWERFRKL